MEALKCQYCSLKKLAFFLNNIDKPNNDIIINQNELEELFEKNEELIFNICYFYRINIQEKLYNSDEVIDIDYKYPQLSKLFYFALLLDSNIVNFYYSFDFIKGLEKSLKSSRDIKINYLKQIFLSKIIIMLVDNTKGFDYYYKSENKNELEKIKNSHNKIIKENLDIFNKNFKLQYDIKSFFILYKII